MLSELDAVNRENKGETFPDVTKKILADDG
jgi:hypothetical protein